MPMSKCRIIPSGKIGLRLVVDISALSYACNFVLYLILGVCKHFVKGGEVQGRGGTLIVDACFILLKKPITLTYDPQYFPKGSLPPLISTL
jgi:hypothetical protein